MEQIIKVEQISKTTKGGETKIDNIAKRAEIRRIINLDNTIQDIKEVLEEMEISFYNDRNLTGHMIYKDKIYKETFVIDQEVADYVDNQHFILKTLEEMQRQHIAFQSFLQNLEPKESDFLNKHYRSYELPNSKKLSALEEKTYIATQVIGNNIFQRKPPNEKKESVYNGL